MTTIDEVVAVGVNLHVKLLAVLHVSFCHFSAVAVVDVVICRAVNEEEVAVEVGCALDGVDGIAFGIFSGRAHVTFGINGVVILPVRWSGNGYTSLEDGATFGHGHEGVESSETPSPNSDVLSVDIGERTEVNGGFNLVVRFKFAKAKVSALFKFRTASACASTVNTHEDESLLRHVTFVERTAVHALIPRVGDFLRTWS